MLSKILAYSKVFLPLFGILLQVNISAQGKYRKIDQKAGDISSVPYIILPKLDNEKLRRQYKFYEPSTEVAPMIFAEKTLTSISPAQHGSWESSIDGHLLWRQIITSKDAYSLNLGFTNFHLPQSAALFISNLDRTHVIGPIHQGDNDVHGEWWSPILPFDEVILEIQIAPEELKELQFELTSVQHDFSGFGALLSASCNLDVLCGAADGFDLVDKYRDMINSVSKVVLGGTSLCSGVLVNTTANDCTPYMITANHCGITASSAPSILTYWNYQNSTCRTPNSVESGGQGNGNQTMFNSGSILRARYQLSDFALVELDDPIDPSLNPFFAGWDWQTEDVDTSFTIHHPQGEEKRISFDFDPATFNVNNTFVRVEDWDIGTTEQGSSGGPLFNSDGRFIGQLNGGRAACGNDLQDDFGMLKISWEGGGTPDTRLRDWLDPINSGATAINGRFCRDVAITDVNSVFICPPNNPRDTVRLIATSGFNQLSIVTLNSVSAGIDVQFSANTIQSDETVNVFIEINDQFVGEEGLIVIAIEGNGGNSLINLPVTVSDGAPDKAILESPSNFTEDLNFDITFKWNSSGAQRNIIEFSLTSDFSIIVRSESTTSNEISLRGFEAQTSYNWRVRSINTCGESLSTVFTFTTGEILCRTYKPGDVPISIGIEPETINSVINVTDGGEIGDVNVLEVRGNHTWISDLSFVLKSPAGTEVALANNPCLDEDNYLASFDDNSTLINFDCPFITGRTFKPAEPLSALNGEQIFGEWSLIVIDGVSQDSGSLDFWTLELCYEESGAKSFSIAPSEIEICDKDVGDVDLVLALIGNWVNPSNPVISTGSGMSVAATISPDPIDDANQVMIHIEDPAVLIDLEEIAFSFSDDQDVITQNIPVRHISDVSKPGLLSPEHDEQRVVLTPSLIWNSGISNGGIHKITLSENMDLSDPIFVENSTQSEFISPVILKEITTYYWQVEAIGTCADRASDIFSFTTDERVATIDEELLQAKIFPSPVSDLLTIDLKDVSISDLNFEIRTSLGQMVHSDQLTKTVTQLDVSIYPPGIYLVSLRSKQGISTKKIVIGR